MKRTAFKNPLNFATADTEERAFEIVVPGEPISTKTKSGKAVNEQLAQDKIRREFEKKFGKINPVAPVTIQIQAAFKAPGRSRNYQQYLMQHDIGVEHLAYVTNLARTVLYALAGTAYRTPGHVEQVTISKQYNIQAFTRIVVIAEVEV